ncbi:KilA-N domain-containing protein [Methylobacterium hispanicum]|uniref:KilA-N domain-containing protein n=1 Tax=Methylobacterium hispanicum TaxID=270350 RepID=UPI002F327840
MQHHLDLIPHKVGPNLVHQRPSDGYINATAMCKATGKQAGDYGRLAATTAFLDALSVDTGIPVSELVQVVKGGPSDQQGTWVHPDVAINLGQWCSPAFAVQVSRWVREWMSARSKPQTVIPYHLRRHMANHGNVPPGHFSILVEMTTLLIAPMEVLGYTLPERMWPDISQGRIFCKWLRDEWNIDTDSLPTYRHHFEDGRIVPAKAYPDDMLKAFRQHFWTVWLPERAQSYFASRDAEALQYLPIMIAKATAAGLPMPIKKLPPRPVPKQKKRG